MIRLENVKKTFLTKDGPMEAVKNLSLDIPAGKLCVFLGPSGCGKTTSLKMINRLIPLSRGKIFIDGVDIMQLNPNTLRRGIGYAIQNIGLFPHLTVEQNIATVPGLQKWPEARCRERAAELLNLVGMNPAAYLKRYPRELSGGQQQRVGVARALGADPPILLMDEPFGAIDPITRNKLQDEFLKIQAKLKKTIVFVTHDIDEAIKMGDSIALMKQGELIQYGEPADLLYNPVNDFVQSFVGSDHHLKGLRLHTAAEFMQPPPLIMPLNSSPAEIVKQLETQKQESAILIDEMEKFCGVVHLSDLKAGEKTPDLISGSEETIESTTRLNVALSLLLSSSQGVLVVLDDLDRPEGILTFNIIQDILNERKEALS